MKNEKTLNSAYNNLSGFNITTKKSKHVVSTYGELTLEGYKKMMKNIKTKGRNFYDLGSGIGKVIMYSYLYSNFDKSIGIEYHKSRVTQARTARKRIIRSLSKTHKNHKTNKKTPILIKGSIFNKKYYDNNKDSVYFISNLCFSDEMNNKLAHYFDKYRNNTSYNTILFCSRELPISTSTNHSIQLDVKMSWSSSSAIYKYIF